MFKSRRYVAIDIGTSCLKMVEGGSHKGQLNINRYAIYNLVEGFRNNDGIVKKDEMYLALSQCYASLNTSNKECVISITTPDVVVRRMELPNMPLKALSENIMHELNQYIPIDLSKYKVDYKILGFLEANDQRRLTLLVVAMPRNIIDDILNLTRQLKLKIKAVDLDFNAIFKFYKYTHRSESNHNEYVMIIDMGHEITQVSILNASDIFLYKIIQCGGRDLTAMIAKAINIEFSQAERLKCEKGIIATEQYALSDLDRRISNAIRSIIDDMLLEINRVIDYFIFRNRTSSIKQVYLTGGSALIKGLSDYFSAALNMPVKLMAAETGTFAVRGLKKDIATFDMALFANAAGLTIREV